MATRQPDSLFKEELIQRDMQRLHAMGYAQELYRAMGGFSNFAISFTIISILSGCLTLFGAGLNSAGPVAGSIGWPLVSLFVLMVALSMPSWLRPIPPRAVSTSGPLNSAARAEAGTPAGLT